MNAPKLGNLHNSVAANAIANIFALTQKLQAEGQEILDLSIGEPDFDTPDHIKQAAVDAIWRGETKYTVTDGTAALKSAIIVQYAVAHGIRYDPSEVVADSGGKAMLAVLFRAILNAGDSVVTQLPCYGSYTGMIQILGATIAGIPAGIEDGFRLSPQRLDVALQQQGDTAKIFLLNNPHNPTGVVYSADELQGFATVLRQYPHLWIVVDEVYENLLYGDADYVSLLRIAPDLRSRLVTMNSISKSYAMTGWRLGYAVGPTRLMDMVRDIMANCSANPCAITQAAGVEALNGGHGHLQDWRKSFAIRRDMILTAFTDTPLKTLAPQAGMFVYYHCGALLETKTPDGTVLRSSNDLAAYLLTAARVAVVPGAAFGLDPYIRLSLVAPQTTIEQACVQMLCALKDLRN